MVYGTYVVTKIMMYDVLLQIIETFPYNDGKIYNHLLKNNINESIYGKKYPIIGLLIEVCCIQSS